MVVGSGVGPDYLHNLLREMISQFIPKKLDKMSDQCQIFLGQILIIKIFIVKPGGIIMVFDDCLQSVQIKDSPGIEDFNIKIEVSGLIFIAFFLKGLTVNGKDAGCQLPYIFVVIIDGFNISISLIGMADIVAEPENIFVTGRGFDIILMCKVETKVIAERTVKRVQILIIPVYSM